MANRGAAALKLDAPAFPRRGPPVDLGSGTRPRFLVTVDTEEEFDWSAPFARDAHGLTHLRAVDRFQKMCAAHGVSPLYLVDYPVAQDDFGAEYFGRLVHDGTAEVGLQLHPWVTPPFDETVNAHNSYACNLPVAMERSKLRNLHALVHERIGVAATIYRAGRYGIGGCTAATLEELGIRFDTSVRPLFDYSGQGGPDFATALASPYWAVPGKLVELPLTSVFAGLLRHFGEAMFNRMFETGSMRALLARGGMLERIALTPEGIPAIKAIEAIDLALDLGLPLLVFSFHSPSLAAGHTPYVRDAADLEYFYRWWDEIFSHLTKQGIAPVTVAELETAAFGK